MITNTHSFNFKARAHEGQNEKILPQALVARNTPAPFNFLFTYLFSIKFLYFFIISSLFPYFNLFVSIFIQSYVNSNLQNRIESQALVARSPPAPFNFLFTYLFSIKFLYFFIISSLFPYFNLFVSIFIQSYVNNNLHNRIE
jgi:hypothetical protein